MPIKPKFSKFYFPGMISLVCIPFLCIYLFFDKTPKHCCRLEFITISNQNLIENSRLSFLLNKILEAKQDNINLFFSGDKIHDKYEQQELSANIERIIIKKDTINGIMVALGNHSKYAELVNIVDLCHQPKNKNIAYAFYNNRFYIRYMSFNNLFEDDPSPKAMPL